MASVSAVCGRAALQSQGQSPGSRLLSGCPLAVLWNCEQGIVSLSLGLLKGAMTKWPFIVS